MPSDAVGKALQAIEQVRTDIALIRNWAGEHSLDVLKADLKTRYAIERAFIWIDAAMRDLPKEKVAAHGIPTNLIAGFCNALAHTYDDILDERVLLTVREDLPALGAALARMAEEIRGAGN